MSKESPLGKVTVRLADDTERQDSLFRVSVKALIFNDNGELLVVKEEDKDWDLPGGGMEHGDDFNQTLARELEEEIGYTGPFTARLASVEAPEYIQIDCYQLWIGFFVELDSGYAVRRGTDAKDIGFVAPEVLFNSKDQQSQVMYRLYQAAIKKEDI